MTRPFVTRLPARFVLLIWFCVAAVIAYVQRTAISLVAVPMQDSLQLSSEVMGLVMSSYYWSYAFSQIPAGILVGRYGSRIVLPVSVAIASLLAGLVALTASAAQFSAIWFLAGVAIAGIFPSCVRSISQWFPANQRAFPSGALASAMSVGAAISTALTAWLLVNLAEHVATPWRLVFVLYAVPGVIWAILFFFWFRHREPETAIDEQQTVSLSQERTVMPESPTPASSLATAPLDRPGWLTDRRTLLICSQQFFRAGGYIFFQTWFPAYLTNVHQVALPSVGLLSSLPFLGVVIGGIAGGWLCDWIEQRSGSKRLARQGVGIFSHAVCGLLILSAQFAVQPTLAVLLISLGTMIFALGSSGSYAINMDLGGSRSATIFSLMNMCGNIGAAVSPIVAGVFIQRLGWSSVLPLFGAIFLASAGCWLFLNPVSCRRAEPIPDSDVQSR